MDKEKTVSFFWNQKEWKLSFTIADYLQLIYKYNGSNIELIITLIDNRELIGTVKIIEGVNIIRWDEYLPVIFEINTEEGIEKLYCDQIKSIIRKD